MILPIIAIASLIISLVVFFVCFASASKIYWIPIVFVSSFGGFVLIWTAALVVCTLFVDKKKPCKKSSRLYWFFARCVLDSATQLLRVKINVSGLEKLPKEKFLLVGNHKSYMDPLITMKALLPNRIGFVGASDAAFGYPVISGLLHKNFCISIDRQNSRDGVRMVNEAADIIKSQVASMGIYPEGKRNLDDGLLEFRNGAFKIAKKANCPIVVAVLKNVEKIKKNLVLRKTHVSFEIVSVIQPDEIVKMSTKEIGEFVHNKMQLAIA